MTSSAARRADPRRTEVEAPVALSQEDRGELADLINRYSALVDGRDYAAVADLFSPDGVLVAPAPPQVLDPSRELVGRAKIQAELGRLSVFDLTYHGLLGQLFGAGDRPSSAVGQVKCVAHHVGRHGRELRDVIWHLHYRDEYEKTSAGWAFARREIAIDLIDSRLVRRARINLPDAGPQQRGRDSNPR